MPSAGSSRPPPYCRTLVYGLLTALLAGVYAGTVLVLGQAFGGVGRAPPSWVVAGATLTAARTVSGTANAVTAEPN